MMIFIYLLRKLDRFSESDELRCSNGVWNKGHLRGWGPRLWELTLL